MANSRRSPELAPLLIGHSVFPHPLRKIEVGEYIYQSWESNLGTIRVFNPVAAPKWR